MNIFPIMIGIPQKSCKRSFFIFTEQTVKKAFTFGTLTQNEGTNQINQNVMLLQFSLVTKVTKEVSVKVDPFCCKIGTKRRG